MHASANMSGMRVSWHGCSCRSCLANVPAQSGSVTHRRGRGCCRVAPVRLGAEGPLGSEELVEVGWVQCWVSSIQQHNRR